MPQPLRETLPSSGYIRNNRWGNLHSLFPAKGTPLYCLAYLHSEGRQRREDVREQNDAVGVERVPRLQRDLDDQLGGFGALAEAGVLLGKLPVGLLEPETD